MGATPQAVRKEKLGIVPTVRRYVLRLYVAGSNPKSAQAIQAIESLCAGFPSGRCKLEVVDLYQQPELARRDNVIALPCLLKVLPPPARMCVGVTQGANRILQKLGIPLREYDGARTKTR